MQQFVTPSMHVSNLLFSVSINLTLFTAMSQEQWQMIVNLRDPPSPEDADLEMLDAALNGDATLDVSHEGGELEVLMEFRRRVNKTYCPFSYDLCNSELTCNTEVGIIAKTTAHTTIALRTGRSSGCHNWMRSQMRTWLGAMIQRTTHLKILISLIARMVTLFTW